MRQFIALEPSPGFLSALEDLRDCLRAAGVTGRFREPSGLHLTLAFIGEWPEEVTEYLPEVRKPFPLVLKEMANKKALSIITNMQSVYIRWNHPAPPHEFAHSAM